MGFIFSPFFLPSLLTAPWTRASDSGQRLFPAGAGSGRYCASWFPRRGPVAVRTPSRPGTQPYNPLAENKEKRAQRRRKTQRGSWLYASRHDYSDRKKDSCLISHWALSLFSSHSGGWAACGSTNRFQVWCSSPLVNTIFSIFFLQLSAPANQRRNFIDWSTRVVVIRITAQYEGKTLIRSAAGQSEESRVRQQVFSSKTHLTLISIDAPWFKLVFQWSSNEKGKCFDQKSETIKKVLVAPSFCFWFFSNQNIHSFTFENTEKTSPNQGVSTKIKVDVVWRRWPLCLTRISTLFHRLIGSKGLPS